MPRSRLAIITVGQDLLQGQVEDSNTAYAKQRLHELGAELVATMTVPDDVDSISQAVSFLKDKCDFLITSGGMGATHNDVTMAGVAKALNQELVRHPYLKTIVGRFCETTDMSASQLRLAEIPAEAELLVQDDMHIPQVYVDNIYIIPGTPEIFRARFEKLVPRFSLQPFNQDELILRGMETQVAAILYRAVKLHPQVTITPCFKLPEGFDEGQGKMASGTIRLLFQADSAAEITTVVNFIKENLPQDITLA